MTPGGGCPSLFELNAGIAENVVRGGSLFVLSSFSCNGESARVTENASH